MGGQFVGAIKAFARVDQRRLSLGQLRPRRRQREFLELLHPCFRLSDRAAGLHDGGLQFARLHADQLLAPGDPLPFLDKNILNRADDLAADFRAIGGLDIAARDDGLHERRTPYRFDHYRRAENDPCRLPETQSAEDNAASANQRCAQTVCTVVDTPPRVPFRDVSRGRRAPVGAGAIDVIKNSSAAAGIWPSVERPKDQG